MYGAEVTGVSSGVITVKYTSDKKTDNFITR